MILKFKRNKKEINCKINNNIINYKKKKKQKITYEVKIKEIIYLIYVIFDDVVDDVDVVDVVNII